MIIYHTEQRSEEWLEARRGVITSTKAKNVMPTSRTPIPAGMYELLAEKIAVPQDGEKDMERGVRLEDEITIRVQDKLGITFTSRPGMWVTDDRKIGVSPDAAQESDRPTYAAEFKALASKNHLQFILNDWQSRKNDSYNPIDNLKAGREDYSVQAVQYFTVNPYLETLYFCLYDDRIALDNLVLYIIKINRSDVENRAKDQEIFEREAHKTIDKWIEILKGVE